MIMEGALMTMNSDTNPLRLPRLLRAAVENLSKRDGTSVNQFVVLAVAEKVSAIVTADGFVERRVRADMDAFYRIMSSRGGKRPLPGDEVSW